MTRDRSRKALTTALLVLVTALAPLGPSVASAPEDDPARLFFVHSVVLSARQPIVVEPLDVSNPPPPVDRCLEESPGEPYQRIRRCSDVEVAVASFPSRDATLTVVEQEGLYVEPASVTFTDLGSGIDAETARFAVRALTPGFHTLTVELTAAGSEPKRLSLPLVWSPGGPPLAGDDSLAGAQYALTGYDTFECSQRPQRGCAFRISERVSFVDGSRSSASLAVEGKRGCRATGPCQAYHFDAGSGLVQVGDDRFGRLDESFQVLNNFQYERLNYPRPRQRLKGDWLEFAKVGSGTYDLQEGRGVYYQRLTLKKNGRFDLAFKVDTTTVADRRSGVRRSKQLAGTYRIGRNGKLALRNPKGRTVMVATLAFISEPDGTPASYKPDLWLDLPVKVKGRGTFIDGNRLSRVGP